MARTKNLASSDVITVESLKEKPTKVVVELELNGGTVSITPTCKISRSSARGAGAGAAIEYSTPGATGTKATAAIAASGVYIFYPDGLDLILTCGAVTGAPRLHWEILPA